MPDFISDNFGVVVVLVIAGISIMRKLLEAVNGNRQGTPPTLPAPSGPSRPMRRPYTPPPLDQVGPPAAGRQSIPPPPLWPAAAPAGAADGAAELTRQMEMEERLRKIREAKSAPVPIPVPVAQAAATVPPRPRAHGVLHRRLRHPGELRRAFVLKEILDHPVALRG